MKHPAQMSPAERDAYRVSFARSKSQRREPAPGLVVFCDPERPCAMAFAGKALKPAWNYRFRDDAHRDAHIAKWAADRQAVDEYKAEQKSKAVAPHTLKVGDILHSQWGYDQTNNDYFQVTALIGTRMVEIREIGNDYQEDGWLRGKSKPMPGKFIGEPMRKVVNHNSVRIESYTSASLWSGRETYESHYA